MVEKEHPFVAGPPGGLCWKRSNRGVKAYFPQKHAELVVLLCTEGRADYFIDGKIFPMQPGSILWALAGQSHFLLDERPGFDMWVMLVAKRLVPDAWHDNPAMPPFHIEDVASAPEIRVLDIAARAELDQIATSISQQDDPSSRGAGILWWLLRAWQNGQSQPDGRNRKLHPAVARAVRLIEDDPAQSLTDIADRVGLSSGRLSKVFIEQMNEGFAEFRNKRRLRRVISLMENPEQTSLLDAVLAAGFGSYTQFYRSFVAAYGQNPRTYFARMTK